MIDETIMMMKTNKNKILVYRLQLLLIAFFVLGFAFYIAHDAVNDKNKAIEFSQLEVTGAEVLPSLKNLLINTQKLRKLTFFYNHTDTQQHKELQEQVSIVQRSLQNTKNKILQSNLQNTMPLFIQLNKSLKNSFDTLSYEQYSSIIYDELALIVKVGDMSNLILDPDLDTYYLMDMIVNKLPLIMETTSQLRDIGTSLLNSTNHDTNEHMLLAVKLGSLKENINLIKNGLESAYSYNHELRSIINPHFVQLGTTIHHMENQVSKIIKKNTLLNAKEYLQNGTRVLEHSISLYDLANQQLIKLLKTRIDTIKAQRDHIIILGVIFFIVLVTLFYIAYDYLHKSLLVREAAEKEKIIVEQLQKTNDSLFYTLSHDRLTGLFNRNTLMKNITQNPHTTIMLIDIESFKEINDIYGNEFGNKVLTIFTEFLNHFFQESTQTTLYRIGGDEFAVLFENTTVNDVRQMGTNLEKALKEETFLIDNIRTNITVNIAINNISPLLENADLALKVIKKDVNEHVIEYKKELNVREEWQKNIQIINMVKAAIAQDRITAYFQGIVNLKTMQIEKYEALVRLILPSGEVLSPYAFLTTISKTHYYYDITKIMIEKTIKMAKQHPALRFSINLSMKDIVNNEVTDTLFKLFDADLETAKRIDIELLETELITLDDKRINSFIAKLHKYGSKVLIDDFGTGYSNFSYLSSLDADMIKVDASIIREITSAPRKLHILRTIHSFTSGLQMKNVAEFVETKEVALLLQKEGIEYAQGYLFSKPSPQPLDDNRVIL